MGMGAAAPRMAGLCACLVLGACASTPASLSTSLADIEKAADVGQGGFVMYAPTTCATANGGRMNADFEPGVFAQSAHRVHVLSYDRIAKAFRQDMAFETASMRGIALVPGPLGRKQLQIQTESGLVACEMGGVFSGGHTAADVYDRLVAAGVRTFSSPGLVNANIAPQPTVITIYMPPPRR